MGIFSRFIKKDKTNTSADHPDTFVEREVPEKEMLINALSPKEKEVFDLLLTGKKLREIADMTGRSFATINTHQTNIYKKLCVNSRAELIIKFKTD